MRTFPSSPPRAMIVEDRVVDRGVAADSRARTEACSRAGRMGKSSRKVNNEGSNRKGDLQLRHD